MSHDDAALETLFLPFRQQHLPWPDDGALFIRARDGWPLHDPVWRGLLCLQSFKPQADALQRSGFTVLTDMPDDKTYPLILMLPPRQRDEARAWMAKAVSAMRPGGRVVACVGNNEGARSSEADLARIAGPLEVLSKNKCRVFWTASLDGPHDAALAAEWRGLDAARPIANGAFLSRPGVFAWDRIDAASALLAAHFPADLQGRAADLGAGFGYLSVELLSRCANITALDLYEAELRALELARLNLRSFESHKALEFRWRDVTGGLPESYDVIVSNPPFHTQGAQDRPDIGRRFIHAAAEALRPGGQLWLVANRHLAYESVLNASFGKVRTVAQAHGFKVIAAIKARA